MAKIRNDQLATALAAVHELSNQQLPMRAAIRLRQIQRALETAHQDFEQERLKLATRHAQKDETDQPKITTTPDGGREYHLADPAAFQTEYAELRAVEVECPGVDASAFGNAEVKAALLTALGPLLIEPEE